MELIKKWLWPIQKDELKQFIFFVILKSCLNSVYFTLHFLSQYPYIWGGSKWNIGTLWSNIILQIGLAIFVVAYFFINRYKNLLYDAFILYIGFFLILGFMPYYLSSGYLLSKWFSYIGVNILFWQFFNHALSMNEWKRFYPWVLILSSFIGVLLGGGYMGFQFLPLGVICFLGIGYILGAWYSYWYLNDHYKVNQDLQETAAQSIKTMAASKEFWLLSLILLCGLMVINLISTQMIVEISTFYHLSIVTNISSFLLNFLLLITLHKWKWKTHALLALVCALSLILMFYLPLFNKDGIMMLLIAIMKMFFYTAVAMSYRGMNQTIDIRGRAFLGTLFAAPVLGFLNNCIPTYIIHFYWRELVVFLCVIWSISIYYLNKIIGSKLDK